MKKDVTTRITTCDACGKECEPVRQFSVVIGHDQEFNQEMVFKVSVTIPYGTDDGDVCNECLMKALNDYLGKGTGGGDMKTLRWEHDVSAQARETMDDLGSFGPTCVEENRPVKGWMDDGECGTNSVYWSSKELRVMAAHFIEVADWLDRRANVTDGAEASP